MVLGVLSMKSHASSGKPSGFMVLGVGACEGINTGDGGGDGDGDDNDDDDANWEKADSKSKSMSVKDWGFD